MGILKDGPNGGFSGKTGSVVGYQLRGKWIIRSLPKLSAKNKKGTIEQNICRSKFRIIQEFLKPILPFIRIGFNLEGIKNANSAHNSAVSYNVKHAFDENGGIDYAAFRFASGDLPTAEDAKVEINSGNLVFTWTDNSAEGAGRDQWDHRTEDLAVILVYDPKNKLIFGTKNGASRSKGREVIQVDSSSSSKDYHTWITFIAEDRQSIANCVYTGMVTI